MKHLTNLTLIESTKYRIKIATKILTSLLAKDNMSCSHDEKIKSAVYLTDRLIEELNK